MSPQQVNLSSYPTLFYQTGWEQSQNFVFNFAYGLRHFVLRLTGGCEMSDQDAAGLVNLEEALAGGMGIDGQPLPYFSGFGIFGGTRYKRLDDPKGYIPGITEVLPKIAHRLPEAAMLGIVGKTTTMQRYTPYGIVVDEDQRKGTFTVIHPSARSLLVLQPTADRAAPWTSEYQESYRLCHELGVAGWDSLLVVYNGGSIVEKEVNLWADRGQELLIVAGSGRKADAFAGNEQFLREHPNVHVCGNEVGAIRASLEELGALTQPHQ